MLMCHCLPPLALPSSEEPSLLEGKTIAAFVSDYESKSRALRSLPHLVSVARALFLVDPANRDKASTLIAEGLDGGRGVTLENCLDALKVEPGDPHDSARDPPT